MKSKLDHYQHLRSLDIGDEIRIRHFGNAHHVSRAKIVRVTVQPRRHRISLIALAIINTANRIAEWRERYHAWRYGDKQVGDTLINRMEKL